MKERKITGFASIDDPQSKDASFYGKHPIIPSVNIYTLLKILSMQYPERAAVSSLDLHANYKQLIEDSVTISLALKELGVKKGDIIAVSMPNLYQAVAAFFACNRIGAVTTFLDSKAPVEEICEYVNQFESPILINYDKAEEYNKKIKDTTGVRHIITLDKQNSSVISLNNNYRVTSNDSIIDFNSLGSIAQYRKSKLEPLHSKKEDALILFTSGSTGKPKAVVLTNENVLAAEIYAMNTSHTENITGTKTLTCVPFSYPYGFVTSALTTLLWGKEAILAPEVNKDTISQLYSTGANIIFGSPALLDLTMRYIPEEQDLSSVELFISGGDFLSEAKAKRATEFFKQHGAKNVEVGNGSGNAETVSIGSTPVGVPLRQETAGRLLVGTKNMIVDPETLEEKKYGEEGMLCSSGKHVFKGYYKNQELTDASMIEKNGRKYYKTGTLGSIDEDGYFTITGRESRFYIMSSLNKVYCDKVQGIISTFDGIRDCAVVKVPDEDQLYVNKAYVILEPGYFPTQEMQDEINNRCYLPATVAGKPSQLKPYEIPTYIEFVEELPRKEGSEKIDYQALEKDAIEKLPSSKRLAKKSDV